MNVKHAHWMDAFRVARLFIALLAYAPLMGGCNQSDANADRVVTAGYGQTISRDGGLNKTTHKVAADCDASSDNVLVEESFSGEITSLGDKQFMIKDDKDAEHTFTVNDDTMYTLDGNESIFSELKVNHSVTVMAEKDGEHFVAKMVDAISGK